MSGLTRYVPLLRRAREMILEHDDTDSSLCFAVLAATAAIERGDSCDLAPMLAIVAQGLATTARTYAKRVWELSGPRVSEGREAYAQDLAELATLLADVSAVLAEIETAAAEREGLRDAAE